MSSLRLPALAALLVCLLLGLPAAHGSAGYALVLGKPVSAQQARSLRDLLKRDFTAVTRGREVYQVRAGDGANYVVKIGFFPSVEEAYAARRRLHGAFPAATVSEVSPAEAASLRPAAVSVPAAGKTTTPVANKEVEARAERLMTQGREALTRGDNDRAVRVFNELLNLPPNTYSQDAQEFVGVARERSGQIAKAKTEYALYLKLYPSGDGAERVRQRLANLDAAGSSTVDLRAPKKKPSTGWITYGGLSQYYYRGENKIDTTNTIGTTTSQSTFSDIDQSMLVTHLDVTSRYRGEQYDARAVLRAMNGHDFLDTDNNRNRLTSAYVDVKDRDYDYGARLGRQPGNFGGILGYFDGAYLGYTFYPKWRFNVVAGEPVDPYTDYDKSFYGGNFELGPFAEHWSGNLYAIEQEVEGYTDRQAVGTELRYFDETRSFLGLVDYDVYFNELNIGMMQGSLRRGPYTFNLLLDHRRTPALQLTNTLINEQGVFSISALRQTLSEEAIKQQALDRTPTLDMSVVGISRELNKKWTVSGDLSVSRLSGTPASGTLPATPATGDDYTYTLQTIGTGLITGADVTTLSASYMDHTTFDGESLGLTHRVIFRRLWTLDATARFYREHYHSGTQVERLISVAKLGYRWRERVTLEVEAGVEQKQTAGSTQQEDTTRQFYSLGYRWDF